MTDIQIRPEKASDRPAIRAIVVAAFESDAEGNLVDNIRDSVGFIPELALVAEVNAEIVGHIMISGVSLVDGETRWEIHSLAPIAVMPTYQGQGIGRRLVTAAVAEADKMGIPLVVLEGSPAYYGRLGFEHSVPHGIHLDLPDWAPPEAAQLIRLSTYDPAIRGRVVYPSSFDV